MLIRPLGSSGLQVSALGFGAGHLHTDALTEPEAFRLLDTALGLGITFVDTARGYEASEERIGRRLRPHREEIVLSTKVGYGVPGAADWSRAAVLGGVDDALRRLDTDAIDVVFLHSCSLEVLQRGEALEALASCRDAGKLLVSGYSGENEALDWAAESGAFGALQTSVNIADQHSARETIRTRQAAAWVSWRSDHSPTSRGSTSNARSACTGSRTGFGCARWRSSRRRTTGWAPR